MKYFTLGDYKIPAIGFGTWKLTTNICQESVEMALSIGYRHIDTADIYRNHKEVGIAVLNSKIPRSEIFLTSKVWYKNLKKEEIISTLKRNLEELKTDYIDLYLIHWPNREIPFKESIEGLEELKEKNLIRNWGVSNFNIHHLQDCIDLGVTPAVNQVEFHPSFNQKELKSFCDLNKILITAYSPLGQGYDLQLPEVRGLGLKYNKTPAQIVLNWLNSKGIVVIPKATIYEPIKENFESLDFSMSESDLSIIENINIFKRLLELPFADFNY